MEGLLPDEFKRMWRFDCVLSPNFFRSCLFFPEVLASPGSISLCSECRLTNLMGHSLQMCASLCLHAITEREKKKVSLQRVHKVDKCAPCSNSQLVCLAVLKKKEEK